MTFFGSVVVGVAGAKIIKHQEGIELEKLEVSKDPVQAHAQLILVEWCGTLGEYDWAEGCELDH